MYPRIGPAGSPQLEIGKVILGLELPSKVRKGVLIGPHRLRIGKKHPPFYFRIKIRREGLFVLQEQNKG